MKFETSESKAPSENLAPLIPPRKLKRLIAFYAYSKSKIRQLEFDEMTCIYRNLKFKARGTPSFKTKIAQRTNLTLKEFRMPIERHFEAYDLE